MDIVKRAIETLEGKTIWTRFRAVIIIGDVQFFSGAFTEAAFEPELKAILEGPADRYLTKIQYRKTTDGMWHTL